MDSFVYCWTDHKTNKLYVGWHKGSIDDGYICSSKIVLQEIKNRPNDFTRQIIAEGYSKCMRNLETKILKSVDAKNNSDYYNCHNNSPSFNLKRHTEKTKKIISAKNSGKTFTKSHREKISKGLKGHKNSSGTKNPMYGKTGKLSPLYNIPKTENHKNNIRNALLGKKYDVERCKNMSINSKGKNLGKKWYNNGIIESYFYFENVPVNWIKGRLLRG